jgi:hypothetical protein
MQRLGITAGMGLGDDESRIAGSDLCEDVGEEQPVLVVAHLIVGEPADIHSLGRERLAQRALQKRNWRHPVRQIHCAIVAAEAVRQFREVR